MNFPFNLRSQSVQRLIFAATLLVLALGLLYFAFLGTYNRSYADDWCYAADFSELGLSETLAGYSSNTTYSASRFSLTLFSGLFFPLGVIGYQALTMLLIAFLAWGLFRSLRLLGAQIDNPLTMLQLLGGALLVSFFAIYIAPLRYQSFYWLSGVLPYAFPMIFSIWIAVLIAEDGRLQQRKPYLLALLAALSFFGAAFSESGAAFLLTILLIGWLISQRYLTKAPFQTSLISPLGWSLSWAILGALILALSPVSWERASRYGELAGLFEFMQLTLSYSWDFVRLSLLDLPLPHLALVLTAAFFALQSSSQKEFSKPWRAIVLVALVAFALIAASYAPSALIEKNPPHPRTRVIARTTMLFALSLISYLLTIWLARIKIIASRKSSISILLGALSLLYIARALFLSFDLQPIYSQRAEIWDERHAILTSAAGDGLDFVEVQAIDGAPIGGLRDFRQASRHWVNVCAARVYGVGEISGLP